jgi:hypothetical protein
MSGPESRFFESQGLRLHYADWGNEDAPHWTEAQSRGTPMSAMDQKQTFRDARDMFALALKADMRDAKTNVCSGPEADIDWLIRSPRRRVRVMAAAPSYPLHSRS